MKNVIIDASVIAKWFLSQDEEEKDVALKIKEDFLNQIISISIPTLTYYEVNNLLKSASKSLKINPKQAKKAYEGFLDLTFIVYSTKDLFKNTLAKALEKDISSYDATYLALSEYLKASFYTADEKLVEKVKTEYIKRLNDYRI